MRIAQCNHNYSNLILCDWCTLWSQRTQHYRSNRQILIMWYFSLFWCLSVSFIWFSCSFPPPRPSCETPSATKNGLDFNDFYPNLLCFMSFQLRIFFSNIQYIVGINQFNCGQYTVDIMAYTGRKCICVARLCWNEIVNLVICVLELAAISIFSTNFIRT